MNLAGRVVAIGVVALLLFLLGSRYGTDAFIAGIGLALAAGLVVVDGRGDDDGKGETGERER